MAKSTKKVETKEATPAKKVEVVQTNSKQKLALKLGQIRAKRIAKSV